LGKFGRQARPVHWPREKGLEREQAGYNDGCTGIRVGIVTHLKRVTLTFDNGPTPGITERVLEILFTRGIQSTFFVIGEKLAQTGGRALAATAHSEGHWIANHSMTHSAPLGEKPDAEYARREIEETQNLIGELAHADKLFRPKGGGGAIGPHLLSRAALGILQKGKYTCVLWSSVPGDWRDQDGWVERGVSEIAERDWTVVALHDVENAALPRLPEFLDRLDSVGVEFRQDFPDDVVITRRGKLISPLAPQIIK
jgi:peptidoglycan/xylan/chitin deacetylase (PgdA/CDA1 family)